MNNIMNDVVTLSERMQTTSGDFVNEFIQPDVIQTTTKFGGTFTFSRILIIVLVLIILSILGINIMGYTEIVIEQIGQIVEAIFKFFGFSIISLTDTTLQKTRQGTKFATDTIIDASQSILRDVSDILDIPSLSTKSRDEDSIRYGKIHDEPSPDDTLSEIQSGTLSKTKHGYCYIGTDRGVRSCVKVGQYDKCMSGEIFPRMDVCINPSLRA